MTWRTNGLTVALRNIGRVLGLNRRIAVFLRGPGYEDKYDRDFSAVLKSGDCVWDVGANVGYYTRLFSQRVGSTGTVFAFEPSPVNFRRLKAETASLSNVTLLKVGLGREDGTLPFHQGEDDLGASSRIGTSGPGEIAVDIRSGMSLIRDGEAARPNAIKIDVEGFECEVLEGLDEQLQSNALRVLGIEVHFGILRERGMPQAPEKIETLLRRNGFAVAWADRSHILAVRQMK